MGHTIEFNDSSSFTSGVARNRVAIPVFGEHSLRWTSPRTVQMLTQTQKLALRDTSIFPYHLCADAGLVNRSCKLPFEQEEAVALKMNRPDGPPLRKGLRKYLS
jgi:hypothetical protein